MAASDETAVVAAKLTNPELAAAAVAAWDGGAAIFPCNPAAPAAELDRLFAAIRPTHVLDGDEPRALPGGIPAAAGTVAVIATSGTTGEAKGVELTRDGLDVMGRGYSAAVGATTGDRWLACLPLHHVAGLAIIARAYATGVPYTAHAGFDLERVARSPRDDGTTIVSLVPTTLRRLLDARAPLRDFGCVIVGGAPCPNELRARAEDAGARVVDAYGLSETWGGFAIDGVPIAGASVKVSNEGEILVRGAMVMRGYRLAPEATAAALEDGWLHTGDLGNLDAGRVIVRDRIDDLVKSGGVKVSPAEVEQILARHPAVADVCVGGVPDEQWGERVVAYVVPTDVDAPPSLEALRDLAREHLAAPKLPREVRLVGEIPRSPGGKVLRRLLRA